MKRLLITGKTSYIAQSVKAYLEKFPDSFQVETISLRGEEWKSASFRGFDAVLHTAGMVHQPDTKDDPAQLENYRAVNTRLTQAAAKKAKAEGVGQFLFLSSESVYGLTAPLGKTVTITADTPLSPRDNYGISKLEAEEALGALADENFRVAILRPPVVYGRGCKGNYQTLSKMAKKLPFFPDVRNSRSMLYMDNLSELIRLLIEDGASGTFCPQNSEYVSTSDLVNLIAHAHGRDILMVKGVTWALKLLRPVTGAVDKAFGSLRYDKSLSAYPKNYCITDLPTSVMETEAE